MTRNNENYMQNKEEVQILGLVNIDNTSSQGLHH